MSQRVTSQPDEPTDTPSGRITIAELYRNMQTWRNDVKEDMALIREKIDGLNFVSPEVYQANRTADELRIKALEAQAEKAAERTSWATRAVALSILSLVTTIIGVALVGAGFPH